MINSEKTLNDEPCKWQDIEQNCWFQMPDSLLKCKGKCKFYEYTGTYVNQKKGD